MDKITDLTCRVCLNVEELMVHIYEEVEDLSTDLSSLLEQCGNLKVERSDIFPKYLCKECTSELLIAAKFREKCSRSKEILQQYELQLQAAEAEEAEEKPTNNDEEQENSRENQVVYLELSQQSEIKKENIEEEEEDDNVENVLILPLDFELHQDMVDVVDGGDVMNTDEFEFDADTMELAASEASIDDSTVIAVAMQQEETEFRDFANEIIEFESSQDQEKLSDSADKSYKEVSQTAQPEAQEKPASDVIGNLKYTCDLCGAAFASPQNLKRHIEASHVPMQLFHCPHCSHCFSMETNFIKHTRICEATEPTKAALHESKKCGRRKKATARANEEVTCSYCHKLFQNTFALNMHLRTHTGERPFKCTQCPKAFKTRSTLACHMKRHNGVPDYICSFCNKAFYESTNLQAHIRTHTGEKPHACTVCDKRFSRVFLLQLHMRTHTGEKPYSCPHCTRSFAQLCDVKNHIRTHTGERQFQCHLCSKSFIKRSPFLWHMERHAAMKAATETINKQKEQKSEPTGEEQCEDSQNIDSFTTSINIDLNDFIEEDLLEAALE